MNILIWVAAAVTYVAFRLWYDGPRKSLRPEEVEHFMEVAEARADGDVNAQDRSVLRKFLEEDDGREFLMVNLVKFNPSPVTHPDSGREMAAFELLQEYFRPFMLQILRRAGHPVLSTRAVGGYLDAWNTPENPGWHAAGLVRYRSRRDAMLSFLANPDFDEIHKYKIAALQQTFAFPSQAQMGLYASPRLTVGLLLALVAALLNLALLA